MSYFCLGKKNIEVLNDFINMGYRFASVLFDIDFVVGVLFMNYLYVICAIVYTIDNL
jgi:hypothetical protein